MAKRILKHILKNWNEYEVWNHKTYTVTEDFTTVTTEATAWVSPYDTSYGYTNITIDENSWIKWKEWAVYSFVVNTEMVVASDKRNVRVRIGSSWSWIPVMDWAGTILNWNEFMKKSGVLLFVYKTTYQSTGALHMNNDTSYLAMSVAEWETGTATNARTVRADYLKQIIEYHAGNLDSQLSIPTKTSDLINDSWFITSSALSGYQTTANLKTSLSDNSDSYYPSQKAVKTAVDGKQEKHTPLSLTLTSSGWSSNTQTVTATWVTASNSVIVSPAPTSITDYTDAKIYCSAQGSNSLTFTCDTAPTNDITVNVIILN